MQRRAPVIVCLAEPVSTRLRAPVHRRLLAGLLLAVACTTPTEPATRVFDPPLRDEAGGWRTIVAGDGASCGLDRVGAAFCWGKNDRGQLGNGSWLPSALPTPVSGALRFSTLAMGRTTVCGLTPDGLTYCWGYYAIDHQATPRLVDTPLRFTALAVGAYSVCGLTADGRAHCWSLIRMAQQPAPLAGDHRFRTLTVAYTDFAGGYCGVTVTGEGYCWGEGVQSASQVVRQPVAGPLRQIATTGAHTCAVDDQGMMRCFGGNALGQLGDGTRIDRTTPVTPVGDERWAAVGVSATSTCGLATTGRALCWGMYELYSDEVGSVTRPVAVLPDLRVGQLSVGADHTCFVTPGGAGYCFGANAAGQLGGGVAGDEVEGALRVRDP